MLVLCFYKVLLWQLRNQGSDINVINEDIIKLHKWYVSFF